MLFDLDKACHSHRFAPDPVKGKKGFDTKNQNQSVGNKSTDSKISRQLY